MNTPAFVTGYPRSRTAWIAELLTMRGHSFAYHEATVTAMGDRGAWMNMMIATRPEPFVIDCNSDLLCDMNSLDDLFPSSRIVLIAADYHRRKEAHLVSLNRAHIPINHQAFDLAWTVMRRNYDRLQERCGVLVVGIQDLDDESSCRQLAEFVAPGFPWDSMRFAELSRKHVSQHIGKAYAQLTEAQKLVTIP